MLYQEKKKRSGGTFSQLIRLLSNMICYTKKKHPREAEPHRSKTNEDFTICERQRLSGQTFF